jgi:hypothetical protein
MNWFTFFPSSFFSFFFFFFSISLSCHVTEALKSLLLLLFLTFALVFTALCEEITGTEDYSKYDPFLDYCERKFEPQSTTAHMLDLANKTRIMKLYKDHLTFERLGCIIKHYNQIAHSCVEDKPPNLKDQSPESLISPVMTVLYGNSDTTNITNVVCITALHHVTMATSIYMDLIVERCGKDDHNSHCILVNHAYLNSLALNEVGRTNQRDTSLAFYTNLAIMGEEYNNRLTRHEEEKIKKKMNEKKSE